MQKIGGVNCRVWVRKPEFFFGITTIWFGSNKVDVANPSRLIIDILDMPDFGGGGRHTIDIVQAYWNSEFCDSDKLLDYAIKYNKGTVFKRLGFLAEHFSVPGTKKWLEKCQSYQSSGISSLDPGAPKKGKISSRWNLQINLPL